MTETATPWSEEGYADVLDASRSGSDFEVTFANGDSMVFPAAMFGITDDDFDVQPDPDALGVAITSPLGDVTVSWSQLRSAKDAAFAQELRRRETEESRRVGLRLRALREDKNLSQRDVADLVGMSAPQLSKIESGALDLRFSTIQSLLRAMGASLDDISGPDVPEVSQRTIVKSAEREGLPRDLVARLLAGGHRRSAGDIIERALGWSLRDLLAGVAVRPAAPAALAFKAVRAGSDPSGSPLVQFSMTLANIAREAAESSPFAGLPKRGDQVRREALDGQGRLTLSSLTEWAWSKGVVVISVSAKGDFSAAVWGSHATPVIVLKESRDLAVYWLFDLAHELAHLALGHVDAHGIVDVDSPASRHDGGDQMEQDANSFALQILLPNHEDLLRGVRTEARGSHLRFKGAVSAVAEEASVSPGMLGMIAAYELTEVGEDKDRWGSATNLARSDGPGRPQIQEAARRRLNPAKIDVIDRRLIADFVLG